MCRLSLKITKWPKPWRTRGMALLMVLSLTALLAAVVAEFQFSSRIELQLAFNAKDDLQAEYNALSALRLRVLLLKQGQALQGILNTVFGALGMMGGEGNIAKLGGGGAPGGGLPSIAKILEVIPLECHLLSMIMQNVTLLPESLAANDGETFFQGDCLSTAESEHGKISIQLLRSFGSGVNEQVKMLLLNFLSNKSLERHFQEDDSNGQHAESPLKLIGAITDWIDDDTVESDNSLGDEDRHYTMLKDSYRAKNAPFDSLAELQLVYGIDDELYDILKDHVTIYNANPRIELSVAPDERLLFGLLAALNPGTSIEQFVNNPAFGLFWRILQNYREASRLGIVSLNNTMLLTMLNTSGLGGLVNPSRLREIFSDDSSTTWYTVKAQGEFYRARRKLTAVVQVQEGQFYYYRLE